MMHSTESIFVVKYLREYESILNAALAFESLEPRVLFDEKTVVKNLMRHGLEKRCWLLLGCSFLC
jgi:hypothetical protein